MAAFSNAMEEMIINHFFRGIAQTSPASVYLALYSSDPGDDNSGSELVGSGYVRKAFTFGAPVNGTASNDADIMFDAATANWPVVSHLAVYDALTGGTMLVHGALSSPVQVNDGDNFRIAAGNLVIGVD